LGLATWQEGTGSLCYGGNLPEKPGRYRFDVSGIMGLFQRIVFVNFISEMEGGGVPCVRIMGLWEEDFMVGIDLFIAPSPELLQD
jgi:hypothetical protein